ncbi:phenylalanine--tRNA ligase subunit beta [Patescibacteria group bacterium]
MLISLNWLKDFVKISVDYKKSSLNKVVVGFVEKVTDHPNADKLKIAVVDIGKEKTKIVCGGTNLKEKIYVPVALPGAILPDNFRIQKCLIRGEESNGMICHLSELGLAKKDDKKISIIKEAKIGTPFASTLNIDELSPEELGEKLTLKTAEVEKVIKENQFLSNIVTGKLVSFKKLPDSKHHHEGKIDIGSRIITILFGSVHVVEPGWIIPIALPGAKLAGGEIKECKMHGVLSQGMICADAEMGIVYSQSGLSVFPSDTPLGKPISELIKADDIIFEFDNKSLTHRPDLWGHYGIAREIAAITDQKLKKYEPKVKIPSKGESPVIKIENKRLCPRYCGLIIKDIKVEQSPEWLKRRLIATGHGTHNNIVDVTNYILTELGQPMHAFDKTLIKKEIIVRNAEKNEKIKTLEGKIIKLTEENLVIADAEKPVAVAGVIGGEHSGINEKTTEIILESANFHAANVRRTSTQHGIRTDSVQRFEKSLDPHMTDLAIKKAAELILELCPNAKIAGPITDINHIEEKDRKVDLNIEKTQSKIGIKISANQIKKILESLEFMVSKKNDKTFTVTIPTFRATKDVEIQDDLIEEVARLYGYDNIPTTLPTLPTRLPLENNERFKKHRARELFSYGLGFNEVSNYSFYGADDLKKSGIDESEHLKILNYLSEEQSHLRISLIPNLLRNIELNIKYFDEFKLYEIGHTYKELEGFMPLEEKEIAGVVVSKEKNHQNFYEVKGVIETFFRKFGIKNLKTVNEVRNTPYAHPGKSISYLETNGDTIGRAFMLHPAIQKNYELENLNIAIFEINFTEALKLEDHEKSFNEIPKFPKIDIDISVVIDREIEVNKIKSAIKQADQKLISNISLFDIYEGENIEAGKKAVAYQVELQAPDRTLTDEEMAEIQGKIFKNLEKLGGTIRGK